MNKLIHSNKWFEVSLFIMMMMIINMSSVCAQLKPANAIYFFNEYLMNPAMAGTEAGLKASLGYRSQISSFEGAPRNQFFAASYGFNEKSGVGLKVNNDKAGVLRQTLVSASYAYHLPINQDDRLSFGISATLISDRLNESAIAGDLTDPDVIDVNQRKSYFDGDFGLVYQTGRLRIQGVFPNMVATLKGDRKMESDYSLFFSAVSYQLETELGILEPKLAFRGVKGFENIVDLGTNFKFNSITNNQFSVLGIYHSSKSATVGIGFSFSDQYSFNASYTMGTTQLNGYTIGDFEIGIGLKL